MSESILRTKSKQFAKEIVLLCRDIKKQTRETVLTNQLLRCGTSIGANLHEAQYTPLRNSCGTLRRMLISSVQTVKSRTP